jgi:predicted transcriptional regulator
MTTEHELTTVAQTTQIVAAYVAANSLNQDDLPALIKSVYSSLTGLGEAETEPVAEPLQPAVPVRKSVTPDYIICLEDGKKFKSLKRHLRVQFGMTPDEYRAKCGLPADYPMAAPSYSEKRSQLAKDHGLGRKPDQRKAA